MEQQTTPGAKPPYSTVTIEFATDKQIAAVFNMSLHDAEREIFDTVERAKGSKDYVRCLDGIEYRVVYVRSNRVDLKITKVY